MTAESFHLKHIHRSEQKVVKVVKGKVTLMFMFQRAWGKDESSCLIDILRHAVMSMHIEPNCWEARTLQTMNMY